MEQQQKQQHENQISVRTGPEPRHLNAILAQTAIVSDWIGSRLDYNNYNRLREIYQITTTTATHQHQQQ